MQSTLIQPESSAILKKDLSIILSCECDEPEGLILRHVRPLVFEFENIQKFWNKACKYPTIFGRKFNDATEFMNLFIQYTPIHGEAVCNGLFWVVDDFEGIFYITDIGTTEALAHYSFFSGRHKGRLELVRKMLKHIFEIYGFQRLSAEIPKYAVHQATNFAEHVGFKKEGLKRKAALYKDRWYDVELFGLVRDEFLVTFPDWINPYAEVKKE